MQLIRDWRLAIGEKGIWKTIANPFVPKRLFLNKQTVPPEPMTGRPRIEHPVSPPKDINGAIDFDVWEARLRKKGVRGLPDSELVKKINEARAGNHDSQVELRLAERYANAGYEVEIVRPTAETPASDTPVINEPLSPDLRIRFPGQAETARVDAKFREPGKSKLQKVTSILR